MTTLTETMKRTLKPLPYTGRLVEDFDHMGEFLGL